MTEPLRRRAFLHHVFASGGLLALGGLCSGIAAPRAFAAQRVGPGGFSPTRLKAVVSAMQGFVERNEAAGMVSVLYRHGILASMEAVGWQDKEAGIRMKPDSICRLASMTKPLMAAATLTLMDEGLLSLNDPAEKFLPELANLKVLRDPAGPLDATVPASRPMRIVDLLTHHSGLTGGSSIVHGLPDSPQAKWPLTQAMVEADKARKNGPDAWLKQVAALPLAYDPGSKFNYAISFDVLGVLLARATSMSLPDLMRTRLFEPLGMRDTGFQVAPGKQHRVAKIYKVDSGTKTVSPMEDTVRAHFSLPSFPSGEGGLCSTAHDYLQAARMLLGRGRLGDTRVLSHRAVALMTTNHLSSEDRKDERFAGHGFGLSVAIVEDLAQQNKASPFLGLGAYASVGAYGWPGAYGTSWVADPQEDMVQLFMIQLQPLQNALNMFKVVQGLSYRAIDD